MVFWCWLDLWHWHYCALVPTASRRKSGSTRRFRYSMQTRQYVNQQTATRKTESAQAFQTQKPERQTFEREQHAPSFDAYTAQTIMRPVDLAWNEVGVYPLLTALLGVVGVYFAVWLGEWRSRGTFGMVQIGE